MEITINITKGNKDYEFYNVPEKVAKAIIALLQECGRDDSTMVSAISERQRMTKRELIDRTHLLEEIKKLQKSPWYNYGKNGMAIIRALYNERKEAVEVVRDLCINDEPVITEQEIFDKIRDEVLEYIDDIDIAYEICGIFNKYSTGSEDG